MGALHHSRVLMQRARPQRLVQHQGCPRRSLARLTVFVTGQHLEHIHAELLCCWHGATGRSSATNSLQQAPDHSLRGTSDFHLIPYLLPLAHTQPGVMSLHSTPAAFEHFGQTQLTAVSASQVWHVRMASISSLGTQANRLCRRWVRHLLVPGHSLLNCGLLLGWSLLEQC